MSTKIHVEPNILFSEHGLSLLLSFVGDKKIALITDNNVAELFANKLLEKIVSAGSDAYIFTFVGGESSKNMSTVDHVSEQLSRLKYGRDTCVIGMGGGIATDIAGFIAATYCRGVDLLLIPTTLLAMVDASIGGKNGVNTKYGKNLVGSFYSPKAIFIDITVLRSLPIKDLNNGLAEMVKCAAIADGEYFNWLEEKYDDLHGNNEQVMLEAITTGSNIKMILVAGDERDQAQRNLLNFGHTIGHALELATHFDCAHGMAVAIGMLAEAYMSYRLGLLEMTAVQKLKHLVEKLVLEGCFCDNNIIDQCMQYILLDKKSLRGIPQFVLLEKIGKAHSKGGQYSFPVSDDITSDALKYALSDLLC